MKRGPQHQAQPDLERDSPASRAKKSARPMSAARRFATVRALVAELDRGPQGVGTKGERPRRSRERWRFPFPSGPSVDGPSLFPEVPMPAPSSSNRRPSPRSSSWGPTATPSRFSRRRSAPRRPRVVPRAARRVHTGRWRRHDHLLATTMEYFDVS